MSTWKPPVKTSCVQGGGRRGWVCELTAQACLLENRTVRDRPPLGTYRRTDVPYFTLYTFRRAVTVKFRCEYVGVLFNI